MTTAKSTASGDRPAGRGFSPADVARIRKDFPILDTQQNAKPLVYLDNAATSQKPEAVLDVVDRYYRAQNANIHRGVHRLSQVATSAYEDARVRVQRFLGAPQSCEIIFVRGATEAINLVAQTYGRQHVAAGDEVLISHMEHHSNIVPWQMLCKETGAVLRVAPINDAGEIIPEEFEPLLSNRTKIVAVAHVSNALGTVNPIKDLAVKAHAYGARILVDGAQSAPHLKVDVAEMGCDFFVCSGHKLLGPTGIGALYGKAELLERMPPYQGGGNMIRSVTFEDTTYGALPHKFEAGTPNIAGAAGLAAAIDYLEGLGMDRIAAYEQELLDYGTSVLEDMGGVRMIGTAQDKAAILSFCLESIHPHDIGQILDDEGIAIRAGHHCAQPVMERFDVPATARASLAFYNTKEELDALGRGLQRVKEVFA